tara:strand:- start:10230 stop:10823 length:594 start_codon:yes stop_codon:yes gene_type:complete
MSKAENTKQFIIEVSAPIFNKHGYAATSISDLTKATKLTKGSIYGNFKNKEELAIQAFDYNVGRLISDIRIKTTKSSTALERLFAIVDFYKEYFEYSKKFGGCPILNVGVDANNQNTLLLDNVRKTIKKLQGYIAAIIEKGIKNGEIKKEIKPFEWAIRLDTMIQGAVFMTYTMNSDLYIKDTMKQIESIINNELKT